MTSLPSQVAIPEAQTRLRFNRQEWSGAFGDLGTDLPLIVGMVLAARLDAASVLTVFGLMQIATALRYRMPMPVQPLKAMAALVIAQKLPANVLYGGGLAIGVSMLLLTATGLLEWINRVVPKPVVRGIQCGLGLQLAGIALKEFVPSDGRAGWWLAAVGFGITLLLIGRRRVPAAVILVALGAAYAFAFKLNGSALLGSVGFHLPVWHQPTLPGVWTGFLLLALPQIPLSIANSVLATRQLTEDLFPEKRVTARLIGWTYSLMNSQSLRGRHSDLPRLGRHGRPLCLRRQDRRVSRHLRHDVPGRRAIFRIRFSDRHPDFPSPDTWGSAVFRGDHASFAAARPHWPDDRFPPGGDGRSHSQFCSIWLLGRSSRGIALLSPDAPWLGANGSVM